MMGTAAKALTQEQVEQIVASSRPERLSDPGKHPIPGDHAANVVQLAGWGQTTLAADHLLFPEINGALPAVVAGVIRQLNIQFVEARLQAGESEAEIARKVRVRQYAYDTLLEAAINFIGMESRWLGAAERCQAVGSIRGALAEWEAREATEGGISVAVAVVRRFLYRLKLVQKGASMAAKTAVRIEQGLDVSKPFLLALLDMARAEVEANVYTRMVREGLCRFGNDYALGLRWLRHLGFEQVSTNPVLAALAYSDDPSLAQSFQADVTFHPKLAEWKSNPDKYADEIALYATLLALWDNLHVYRPIFFNLASTSGGGVVSFQLNPNIAHLAQESVRDVFAAFAAATEDLAVYDDYLLAGYPATRERARPNMVIKVAACSPAAREIARTINSFGFGSNITVIYTAGQEVTMVLEELSGMAAAIRKGVVPTQLYMTNMGGRFESHLREVKLEQLFADLKAKVGEAKALEKVNQLAAANGTKPKADAAKGYAAKVVAATRFGSQRTIDGHVIAALADVASEAELKAWEDAIGKSGTLVARRVWGIFWSEENRGKWVGYLTKKHGITPEQAALILSRVCYLPASKRKPQDTYWTLTGTCMVHTEFPNHQENVRRMAEEPGFKLAEYAGSITHQFPPEVLEKLNTIPDFRKGYELNAELNRILREAGVAGDFGSGGHTPEQWPEYGSVQKTVAEFKGAYDRFRDDVLGLFRTAVKPARTAKPAAKKAARRAAKTPAKKGKTRR
ncbi:MAG TPA: hypothetical protein VLT62_16545 [Candidatus Methylomirabilis sp.]|nr:hypothetical protein [Candidatus Methylomirabilis sp.]